MNDKGYYNHPAISGKHRVLHERRRLVVCPERRRNSPTVDQRPWLVVVPGGLARRTLACVQLDRGRRIRGGRDACRGRARAAAHV
jgi:hypothetical protein